MRYIRALIVGTSRDQLIRPGKPKKVKGMSAVELAGMEREMASIEQDYRLVSDDYGKNALHLGSTQRYVRRLIENPKVKRFLNQRHPEILEELQELAALESL